MEEDRGIRDPEYVLRIKTFAMALAVEFRIEIGGAEGFLTRKLYSHRHQAHIYIYVYMYVLPMENRQRHCAVKKSNGQITAEDTSYTRSSATLCLLALSTSHISLHLSCEIPIE